MVNCKFCNSLFEPNDSRQKFCSKLCYKRKYDLDNRKIFYNRNCLECQSEFKTSRLPQVFCGPQCRYNFKIKDNVRNCRFCDRQFIDKTRSNKKPECSAECSKHFNDMTRYGLSKKEYLKIRSINQCQICSSKDKLCIDHCHTSNKVRGVLCRNCNTGIGLLKENLNTITSALEYLKRGLNE